MATSIVDTLFGISPERLERQRAADADARALQFAKLNPFEQANFAIGRGAYGLAGALGGALGGQDPELQRVTMRQQIARQINPSDPETIKQGIVAMQQAGDTEGAMLLNSEYQKIQESAALVAQRNAAANREAKQSVPTDIQVARELSNLETTAAALEAMEPSVERDQALRTINGQLTNLRTLTAKPGEKGPSFGADAERVAAEMFDNKTFGQLTPAQKAAVNKRIDEEGNRRAASTAAKLVLPGQNALVDIPSFRAKVQSTIDPQAKAVFAADNALTAIEDSINTNNFVSFNAARVQLAKAYGDSQLSRVDVQKAGGDPSVLGGLADVTSTLFTGTPTLDTQNKIKKTLQAIKTVATKKANDEINRQRRIALRSPGYDPEAVNAALDFPEFQTAPPAAVATQYATNPTTKERIMSTDGGKTWNPVR
jgi:hypothetical protein